MKFAALDEYYFPCEKAGTVDFVMMALLDSLGYRFDIQAVTSPFSKAKLIRFGSKLDIKSTLFVDVESKRFCWFTEDGCYASPPIVLEREP